ncbi:MAG: penicillin-binding transpeptidase domain-containing protein [Chloroflexi bacterium]|nr:penicillin-binding transpeptidase domain-containing protein [Chloroflexota bacterium]MDA8188089.1 penicillin-binding transpeptidase domain-containing protein [Dehalococcoidales bacterium]
MSQSIYRTGLALLIGFVIIALALPYWQVIRANDLVGDPRYNRYRLNEIENSSERGRILDRNGVVLASTEMTPNGARRTYSMPALAHVTGFHSAIFGDSDIEKAFAPYLQGQEGADPFKAMFDRLLHRPTVGSDVVLTIDSKLQAVAEEAMGSSKGAAVVIQPKTGEILALVSHPYFDPNTMEKDWDKLKNDPGTPMVNRATQGLYVPGSTFKTVILAAALDSGVTNPDEIFDFKMETDSYGRAYHLESFNGYEIYCANHGMTSPGRAQLRLADVFAQSCNIAFARLGVRLGSQRLIEYAKRFGFETQIPLEIPDLPSQLSLKPGFLNDNAAVAATSFGQGQLQASPLQLAMVAATIARGGIAPQPFLVSEIRTGKYSTTVGQPKQWHEVVSPTTAREVADMMVHAVDTGWAKGAQVSGVRVAGKTGTAEILPGETPHGWFIGFAPEDDPQVAVAVIKEYAGPGSTEAVPVGKAIIQAALGK